MSDFIKTKSRRKIQASIDPDSQETSAIDALSNNLKTKFDIITTSDLCTRIIKTLRDFKFTKVRCVALGSPSQEEPALYQLALLKSIIDEFQIGPSNVSLYDPVFSPLDKAYFDTMRYCVEEEYSPGEDSTDILYFLPHAPLSLTTMVLSTQEPILLLANNVIRHTERLTKTDLFEKHPLISKLVNILENSGSGEEVGNDGFQSVTKRKNRRQRNKFTEPQINHQTVSSYFSKASIVTYKEVEEGPWINSFTDLAFHKLS